MWELRATAADSYKTQQAHTKGETWKPTIAGCLPCTVTSLKKRRRKKERKKKGKKKENTTALPLSIAYPILMCHVKLTTFWPLVTDKLSADLPIGYTAFCLVTVKSPVWNNVRPNMHNQHKRELTSIFFFFCCLWSDHNHHVDYFVTLHKFCQQRNFFNKNLHVCLCDIFWVAY